MDTCNQRSLAIQISAKASDDLRHSLPLANGPETVGRDWVDHFTSESTGQRLLALLAFQMAMNGQSKMLVPFDFLLLFKEGEWCYSKSSVIRSSEALKT